MRVRVGCEFGWDTDHEVPMLMLVRPRPEAPTKIVYESRWLQPDVPIHEYVDSFGNHCWRFVAPGGLLTIRYDAVVEIEPYPDPVEPEARLTPVGELPDEALIFTLPSRFIESDLLLDRAWELFGNTPPTWARVQAVCDWVHTNIEFVNGSTGPSTTALQVLEQRKGVCRDFALLAVAFCRALNIPARYTFGYLPDIAIEPPDVPMDFHTWFETYIGDRWYTFDARHNMPRVGRIVIGRGRDAVDVALSTSYGGARLPKFAVWSDEMTDDPPLEGDADAAEEAAAPER